MTARIITQAVYPPVPSTRFDWCAYRDGYEPGCPLGYGASRGAAILDLLDIEADQDETEPCGACEGEGELPRCRDEDTECTCPNGQCLDCNVRCRSCDGEGRI